MAHYLDPKSDLVFKRIFGEHKNLCMSLLNSMLPLEESQKIVDLQYNPPEIVPEIDALKNSIVDVRCTDNSGRIFMVEMQMYWTEAFKSRVLLNASKAYVNQLDKGKGFELAQPVFALTFVNENFEKSPEMKDEYYHYYKIVNIKHTEKQIKGLEFVFIELKKFRPQNRAEKQLQELWLRFLTEIKVTTETVSPDLLEDDDICEAVKYAEISAYTKEELYKYDKWRIDTYTARAAFMDAKREGKMEVALNLLKLGISIEEVAKAAELSVFEIKDFYSKNF